MTQTMRYIISLDEDNDRGGRQVLKENVAALLGFNFNLGAGIGQTLFFPYALAGNGADVTLSIPSLNPGVDIKAPQGATHYELLFGSSALNFETKTFAQGVVAAPAGIQPLSGAAVANTVITATFPAAPPVTDTVVAVLGINFYQQLNGKYYPLNNNASNPLAIEYVA
jgi:hypothetical protein